MQAAVDIPALDALASEEAARGRKGAMPSLEGEGLGAGKPGEPLRRVGDESKDAFVRIDDLVAIIDGEGNHGNSARGVAGARRSIQDGGKGDGRRNAGRRRRNQGRRAHV